MTETVSFRDPSGHVVANDTGVFRYVNSEGSDNLEAFLHSTSVGKLTEQQSIVETRLLSPAPSIVLEHERIPFPSYAHEWAPQMLYRAAELTLDLCEQLLAEGLGIKDATPHNILFRGPHPVFVDVLSVERRKPDDPIWSASAQFSRTFLLPLLLHKYAGVPPAQIFVTRRDGITPSEARMWITGPRRYLPPCLGLITLPAWLNRMERREIYRAHETGDPEQTQFILELYFRRLRRKLNRLKPSRAHSAWSEYAREKPSYSSVQETAKYDFVADTLRMISPRRVLDIGANSGEFSILAARSGAAVVAIDNDPVVIGELWSRAVEGNHDILPLVADIARPTPSLGWKCSEQHSLLDRATGYSDCVLMLAVLHHLLITDQIPLREVVDLAAGLTTRWLILEYVGREDAMFRRLTRGRDSLYRSFDRPMFEQEVGRHFQIVRTFDVPGSSRSIYVLQRN